MKALEGIDPYIFGELKTKGDFNQVRPNEILVLPVGVCPNRDPSKVCVCERCFVGSQTRTPTSIARVIDAPEGNIYELFIESPLAFLWWGRNPAPMAANHLWETSVQLHGIPHGTYVRTIWENDRPRIYVNKLLSESEAFINCR